MQCLAQALCTEPLVCPVGLGYQSRWVLRLLGLTRSRVEHDAAKVVNPFAELGSRIMNWSKRLKAGCLATGLLSLSAGSTVITAARQVRLTSWHLMRAGSKKWLLARGPSGPKSSTPFLVALGLARSKWSFAVTSRMAFRLHAMFVIASKRLRRGPHTCKPNVPRSRALLTTPLSRRSSTPSRRSSLPH